MPRHTTSQISQYKAKRIQAIHTIIRSIECGIPLVVAVADAGIRDDLWRKWWERYPKLRIRVTKAAAKAVTPLIDKSYSMAREGNERRLDAELKARVPQVYDPPKLSRIEHAPPIGRHYAIEVDSEPVPQALPEPEPEPAPDPAHP